MILLSPEEISRAAYQRNKLFGKNDVLAYTRKPNADEEIAKAQLKNAIEWLKEHTIEAYGGNRIILNKDWKEITK